MEKLKRFIGDKRFYSQIFAIILPMMLQQLLLSLAGYVDNLMINSYGGEGFVDAYNGVSAANRLIFILNFTLIGFSNAAGIFISQYFGAGNREKMKESLSLSLVIGLFLGLLCVLVIELLGDKIVDLYLVSEGSRYYGYRYLDYIKWGMLLTAFNMVFANALRSAKQTVLPLLAGISGIFVNVFFNYCFIFGNLGFPELDAGGAAIATNMSRGVELLILVAFVLFAKKSYFRGFYKNWRFSSFLVKSFAKKCTPLVLNEIMWSLGCSLFVLFYTYKNDLWYNAFAYSQNISDLFFIIFGGLGCGTAIVIGSALGADDFERAKADADKMIGLSVFMGAFMGVLMWLTAPYIADLFKPDAATKKIVVDVLHVTSVFVTIYSFNSCCFFILRSGGDSLRAFMLDQGATYLLGLPVAAVLGINAASLGLTCAQVFLAAHICDIVKIFVSIAFVKKKKWLNNLTVEKE